jgi:hypothetical protein
MLASPVICNGGERTALAHSTVKAITADESEAMVISSRLDARNYV